VHKSAIVRSSPQMGFFDDIAEMFKAPSTVNSWYDSGIRLIDEDAKAAEEKAIEEAFAAKAAEEAKAAVEAAAAAMAAEEAATAKAAEKAAAAKAAEEAEPEPEPELELEPALPATWTAADTSPAKAPEAWKRKTVGDWQTKSDWQKKSDWKTGYSLTDC